MTACGWGLSGPRFWRGLYSVIRQCWFSQDGKSPERRQPNKGVALDRGPLAVWNKLNGRGGAARGKLGTLDSPSSECHVTNSGCDAGLLGVGAVSGLCCRHGLTDRQGPSFRLIFLCCARQE